MGCTFYYKTQQLSRMKTVEQKKFTWL